MKIVCDCGFECSDRATMDLHYAYATKDDVGRHHISTLYADQSPGLTALPDIATLQAKVKQYQITCGDCGSTNVGAGKANTLVCNACGNSETFTGPPYEEGGIKYGGHIVQRRMVTPALNPHEYREIGCNHCNGKWTDASVAMAHECPRDKHKGSVTVTDYSEVDEPKPSAQADELAAAADDVETQAAWIMTEFGDGDAPDDAEYDREKFDAALDRLDRALRDYRAMKTFPAKAMR